MSPGCAYPPSSESTYMGKGSLLAANGRYRREQRQVRTPSVVTKQLERCRLRQCTPCRAGRNLRSPSLPCWHGLLTCRPACHLRAAIALFEPPPVCVREPRCQTTPGHILVVDYCWSHRRTQLCESDGADDRKPTGDRRTSVCSREDAGHLLYRRRYSRAPAQRRTSRIQQLPKGKAEAQQCVPACAAETVPSRSERCCRAAFHVCVRIPEPLHYWKHEASCKDARQETCNGRFALRARQTQVEKLPALRARLPGRRKRESASPP